jgi:hypothetical protein
MVPVLFADFAAHDVVPEQEIWNDTKCHQRRGIPKMAVVEIEGSLKNGQAAVRSIAARPRHIGLILPTDEVMAGKKGPAGFDKIGSFTTTRTLTARSHLFVDLKLYSLNCTNTAEPPQSGIRVN